VGAIQLDFEDEDDPTTLNGKCALKSDTAQMRFAIKEKAELSSEEQVCAYLYYEAGWVTWNDAHYFKAEW
jgi:hypothetical protein